MIFIKLREREHGPLFFIKSGAVIWYSEPKELDIHDTDEGPHGGEYVFTVRAAHEPRVFVVMGTLDFVRAQYMALTRQMGIHVNE